MRIVALNHVAFENPRYIRSWAKTHDHDLTEIALYEGEALPSLDDVDWLVVMGGPMSVGDEARFAWLAPEKQYIAEALRQDKVVLGICLGAQLVAHVLGAGVAPMPHKEVGWHPIAPTAAAQSTLFADLPTGLEVFHWHGEMFDVPDSAVLLAGSEACPHQIFMWGDRVIGIQCHAEMTPQGAEALAEHCPDDMNSGAWAQARDDVLRDRGRFDIANAWLDGFLTRLAEQRAAYNK